MLLPIQAGKYTAELDPSRFGPGSRSLCVKVKADANIERDGFQGDGSAAGTSSSRWVSLSEFEAMSGQMIDSWKKSIKVRSSLSAAPDSVESTADSIKKGGKSNRRPLKDLIKSGELKLCTTKNCRCKNCAEVKTLVAKKTGGKARKVRGELKASPSFVMPAGLFGPPMSQGPSLKQSSLQKDNDSDSGISNASSGSLGKGEGTTKVKNNDPEAVKVEDDEEDHNAGSASHSTGSYASMVREAIKSLSDGFSTGLEEGEAKRNQKSLEDGRRDDREGCSRLAILLYILNKHRPNEDINVIHVKVRSALRCLVRMGVVAKSPEVDPVEEEDEDDAGSELRQNQLLELFKVRGSSTSSSTDNFLQDGVSSLSWVNANQGAADDDDDDDPEIKFRRIDLTSVMQQHQPKATKGPASTGKPKKANSSKKSKKLAKENKAKSPNSSTAKPHTQAKLFILSPELAALCGKKKLPRGEVISRIWKHIRKLNLQDPADRSTIMCDSKLKALSNRPKIGLKEVFPLVGKHLKAVEVKAQVKSKKTTTSAT